MDEDLADNGHYDVEMTESVVDRALSERDSNMDDEGDDDDDDGNDDSSDSEDSDSERQGSRDEGDMKAKKVLSKSNVDRVTTGSSSSSLQQQQKSHGGSRNGICANCGQTQTPLWRKDAKGQSICNACGLYARLHQRDRPITMRKTKIARRKRDWSTVSEKKEKPHQQLVKGDMDENAVTYMNEERTEGHGSAAGARKRKELTMNEGSHVEVRAMNIPVSSELESDESSLCLLEQNTDDHAVSINGFS